MSSSISEYLIGSQVIVFVFFAVAASDGSRVRSHRDSHSQNVMLAKAGTRGWDKLRSNELAVYLPL